MVLVILVFLSCVRESMAGRLNKFIRHYEPLWLPLEPSDVLFRNKRSVHSPDASIRFVAFGREFHLVLWRDASVFAKHFMTITPVGTVDVDISHIHSGKIAGCPGSRAFGSVRHGTFEGYIETGDGSEYYVEPGWKYFDGGANFSVIYSALDVEIPPEVASTFGCGVDKLHVHDTAPTPEKLHRRYKRGSDYIEVDAKPIMDGHSKKPRTVTKESLSRRLCNLEVTIDHTLYKLYMAGGADDTSVRERITTTLANHVDAITRIYSNTNFGGVLGISFKVHALIINSTKSCEGSVKDSNPFCDDTLDANLMLERFSRQNHNQFCLAFLWSFRDFSQGTLGLAYVGSAGYQAGGICEKYRKMHFKDGVRTVGLNTGIMTFLNYGSVVPQRVSHITFAHEVGHNFGSPHDASAECAPGKPKGNYIMYPRATPGTEENNCKFSPCSVRLMAGVIHAVLHEEFGKENCFLESEGPLCGNNIREGEEECDCGFTGDECTDPCCYAQVNKDKKAGCKLRPNAMCSPTAGACCSTTCTFMDQNHKCSEEDECNLSSTCNSVSAQCTPRQPKADFTECNKGTQVCLKGHCEGSICQKYGYEDCQLTGSQHSLSQLCHIYCRSPSNDTDVQCINPCDVSALKPLCDAKRQPGAPCDNNNGYCDVFLKCRHINEEGPLTRLQSIFFRHGAIRRWIEEHMMLAIAIGVASILGVALFIKCCAVITPSNNPVLRPARTFKDAMTKF
ncbi:disintegrin and metalloproteinase domain-containing protein 10-like isoform X2 [Ornithodoros turicata]|uniref:disintegrin and metalloproteinase domain-containing protein 10-like isoform X2 n=1 Tax=Ornithodoros turicata TaxID=34597 RepID=UPI003139135D